MAGIAYHPAPGLGDMMPGWWDVPQNPVTARRGVTKVPGIGEIIDAYFVVPQNPIKDYVTGQVKPLGQAQGTTGNAHGHPMKGGINAPPGMGHVGCGCGCGGSGNCGHGGLGAISDDFAAMGSDLASGNFAQFGTDFLTLLQEPTVAGIPLWAFGVGLFFLVQFVFSHQVSVGQKSTGGGSYRPARSKK